MTLSTAEQERLLILNYLEANTDVYTPPKVLCILLNPGFEALDKGDQQLILTQIHKIIYMLRKKVLIGDRVIHNLRGKGYRITAEIKETEFELEKRMLLVRRYGIALLNYSKFNRAADPILPSHIYNLTQDLVQSLDLWIEQNPDAGLLEAQSWTP